MPVISVDMVAGKTALQKRKLIEGFTKTACEVIGCEPDRVTVILREIPLDSWGKDGKPKGK
jgi:4-oxalocrotonate tautomerase family enzyme